MNHADETRHDAGATWSGGLARRFFASRQPALVVGVALAVPLLWYFGGVLFTARSFAFRDAAHYYYPLFQWTSREWSAGRVPLWNPQENCGTPVLADATSSVFYPGKLLFALPGTYAAKYKWYIVGHVFLAAGAAYCLARVWRCSTLAAGLAGLAYACGGDVLFQYCNVVYLIGAAWLPLALLAADRTLMRRSAAWAVVLGVILALMILGGDPQAAYHAGVLAALYALLLWRQERAERAAGVSYTSPTRQRGTSAGTSPTRQRGTGPEFPRLRVGLGLGRAQGGLARHRLLLLGLAATSGAVLSAVQVLPSIEWTRRSQRAVYDGPRTVYEIPAAAARSAPGELWRDSVRGILGSPTEGTHHEHTYLFSVGPWRVAELLWPNCFGRQFPIHRRWSMAIPDEGGLWTPSLYIGLLPFLLALAAWRLRGGEPRVRWMSWCAVLGLLGAFGCFGLGWLFGVLGVSWAPAPVGDGGVGAPVGGLYWLLVTFLPGYVYFRYPAKLLVVTALGLSVLSARGFDALRHGAGQRLRYALSWLSGVSLLLLGGTFFVVPWWTAWMDGVAPDSLLGPLDAQGALADLRESLLHAALLAAACSGLLWWARPAGRGRDSAANPALPEAKRRMARCGRAVLLLTAVDLAVAHGWMVVTAPQRAWEEPSYFAEQIAAVEARGSATLTQKGSGVVFGHAVTDMVPRTTENDSRPLFRVYRDADSEWGPDEWYHGGSVDRHREGLVWDRDTLFPRHPLTEGLSLLESRGSVFSAEYDALVRDPKREVLDALGARYLSLPDGVEFPGTERVAEPASRAPPAKAALWLNPQAFPRAWIVHQVDPLPGATHTALRQIDELTRAVLYPDGQARDLRRLAVVEDNTTGETFAWNERTGFAQREPGRAVDAGRSPPGESCRVVVDEPQRMVVEARLAAPGLVVTSDAFYPGWTAEVVSTDNNSPRPVPLWRTNRVMRGVALPPGEHQITYRYRPTPFYIGAAVSGLSWLAVLVAAGLWVRSGKRLT